MKKIQLIFKKNEIFEEIALNTAYLGAKSKEFECDYPRISTVEEDEDLLTLFWNRSVGRIIETLQKVVAGAVADESQLLLELELSEAYDENLTASLRKEIFNALVAAITAQWLKTVNPDKVPDWETQSHRCIDRAVKYVYHRKRPQRRDAIQS